MDGEPVKKVGVDTSKLDINKLIEQTSLTRDKIEAIIDLLAASGTGNNKSEREDIARLFNIPINLVPMAWMLKIRDWSQVTDDQLHQVFRKSFRGYAQYMDRPWEDDYVDPTKLSKNEVQELLTNLSVLARAKAHVEREKNKVGRLMVQSPINTRK